MLKLKDTRSRLHYGWVVFVLSLGNLTVEGGTKNSEAVFFNALRQSFHSSATYTASIFSLAGLVGALSAPLLGILLDRWGARILFPLAGLCILLGWMASSFVTDLWQMFIFYGIFAGIGHTAISSFSMTATLAPWFPQARGRMLGLADSGNPIGQAIFAPLAAALTAELGWRGAFRIFGVIFAVLIALPNGLLQRRAPPAVPAAVPVSAPTAAPAPAHPAGPHSHPVHPDDSDGDHGPAPAHPAGPIDAAPPELPRPTPTSTSTPATRPATRRRPPRLGRVVRDPTMWLLVLTRITGSTGTQMIRVHLVTFFVLAGYGEQTAANTLGAVGVVSLFARPLVGLSTDRWGRESVYTVGMSIAAGAVLLVLWLGDGASYWPLFLYAALAGTTDGISGLIVGAKAADLFPQESLGAVMGFVEMGRGTAIFLGPILAGLLFDLQGDYVQAFILSAGLTLASICAAWAAHWMGSRRRAAR